MKKLTLIMCLLISTTIVSQINLEQTYPSTSASAVMDVVRLVKSGYKYTYVDLVNKTLKLYNMNHSIWKSMSFPLPPGYFVYGGASLISDSLFNTDALVEFAYTTYTYNYSVSPPTFTFVSNVISETGTVLLNIPQGAGFQLVNTGSNGYKLIATVDSLNKNTVKEHRIYGLVGAILPTSPTQTNTLPTSQYQKQISTNPILSMPMPNPSNEKTLIGYELPYGTNQAELVIFDITGKEIKRYVVDSNFSTLELDNTDIPSGTYFYKMSGISEAKKMVIIK